MYYQGEIWDTKGKSYICGNPEMQEKKKDLKGEKNQRMQDKNISIQYN